MSEVKGTKALELWCKRLVKDCPNVQIENMTTSWRNGMAFCALVHHFRPDLIDVSKLNPENIYENNQLAYSIAEKHLGIPALLDPEDMVESEVPDRLSVLTYLSQFYQRLGHTVNSVTSKASENESNVADSASPVSSTTPIKFGKVNLDKCAVCGLPVYLAQRLIVSQKLYHRRCFRCSKCSGYLNPKNFKTDEVSEFICDACKNDKAPKFIKTHDQIGMLAFSNDVCDTSHTQNEEQVNSKLRSRPLSILEKINIFEKNIEKDSNLEENIGNISLSSISNNKIKVNENHITDETLSESTNTEKDIKSKDLSSENNNIAEFEVKQYVPEKTYKTNADKIFFLQTQLSGDAVVDAPLCTPLSEDKEAILEESVIDNSNITTITEDKLINKECNITDDSRLAQNISLNTDSTSCLDSSNSNLNNQEMSISVPPRRKKNMSPKNNKTNEPNKNIPVKTEMEYPDHLNPFSDDDEDSMVKEEKENSKEISTNPFGSSDEDEDILPPIHPIPKLGDHQDSTPVKRHITACNPFWSDGEEPSSEEEDPLSRSTDPTFRRSSSMLKSPMTSSTPELPASTPRRRKPRAPPPPACTSLDDVASISSLSSQTSTIHSDQKSLGVSTPKLKKKRPAPTPPDSVSSLCGCAGSLEKGVDASEPRSNVSDGAGSGAARRGKGPAPGLPLPARRAVRPQLSAAALQAQLELLDAQQLGLERQGVLIERMIRDKCEGDEACAVPQEEVEDLVIQLCELVNEKNDLFRKQTELMYIRRQQRLEQEQADIEHEIRIIQSQPAVNRIDADKAREEQLVGRLVETVRLRDELVQQLDAERRRERREDSAIAACIATKRAQRNSDSNSSSMKSAEVVTSGKKNKVKDKVKKQLKKAKHSLISKKKDEEKEKEKKPK